MIPLSFSQEVDSPDTFPKLFTEQTSISVNDISVQSGYFHDYDTLAINALRISPLLQTNYDAFNSDKISLNLFDDFVILEKHYVRYWDDDGSFNWVGKVVGEDSEFIVLSVTNGQVKAVNYQTSDN